MRSAQKAEADDPLHLKIPTRMEVVWSPLPQP
jgi:hypothetical protein